VGRIIESKNGEDVRCVLNRKATHRGSSNPGERFQSHAGGVFEDEVRVTADTDVAVSGRLLFEVTGGEDERLLDSF